MNIMCEQPWTDDKQNIRRSNINVRNNRSIKMKNSIERSRSDLKSFEQSNDEEYNIPDTASVASIETFSTIDTFKTAGLPFVGITIRSPEEAINKGKVDIQEFLFNLKAESERKQNLKNDKEKVDIQEFLLNLKANSEKKQNLTSNNTNNHEPKKRRSAPDFRAASEASETLTRKCKREPAKRRSRSREPTTPNPRNIIKRSAAIKIQAFIRGIFQRMDYRILVLEKKLYEIENENEEDNYVMYEYEIKKIKKMREVRESWIHIARERLKTAVYIKDKRTELRTGMVEFLSSKNNELHKEYNKRKLDICKMKRNNEQIATQILSTSMNVHIMKKQYEKVYFNNEELKNSMEKIKKYIHDIKNKITSERAYHGIAYKRGKKIEDCVDNINMVLQNRCTDIKLVLSTKKLIHDVRQYRKLKHAEHNVDTDIYNLLEIQYDLMYK